MREKVEMETHAGSMDLKNKNIVITGANSGLGLEAVRQLAPSGARLLLGCRDVRKAQEAVRGISGQIEIEALDLSSFDSVRKFSELVRQKMPVVDILINNAGVMMPPFGLTQAGHELQLGTNHLGHFLLTQQLFSALAASQDGRVVSVSSMAHRRGTLDLDRSWTAANYNPMKAYADSKLANLVFALELDRRLKISGSRVKSLAAHPGWTETSLFRHMGPAQWFSSLLAMNVHDGTLPIVMAATRADAKSGEYFGPTGFMEMRGRPGYAVPSARAKDVELGRRLWEYSERATGGAFSI